MLKCCKKKAQAKKEKDRLDDGIGSGYETKYALISALKSEECLRPHSWAKENQRLSAKTPTAF